MAINIIPGNVGSFTPTTNVWDTSELEKIDVTKPEFKELLVRLYQNLNLMANVLSTKDSGYYYTNTEFVNGQIFFPNPLLSSRTSSAPIPRQDFRVVVIFGALPNATTKSVPHGINVTAMTTFTRIYGAATNPATLNYIPIPYASATGDNVELWIDATNVNIKTNSATWIGYTITYIIVEYLKN